MEEIKKNKLVEENAEFNNSENKDNYDLNQKEKEVFNSVGSNNDCFNDNLEIRENDVFSSVGSNKNNLKDNIEMREKEVFNSVGNGGFFSMKGDNFKPRVYNIDRKRAYYLKNKDLLKSKRKPLTDEQKEHNKVLRQKRKKGLGLYEVNPNTKKAKRLGEMIKKLKIKIEKLKNG